MKVYVLMENTACQPGFAAEHGLSLYIETGGHKILFDTGASGAFADNAQRLGVDLSQVELAVLSHGHYDHGGGLGRFLELNDHAPVYLSRRAFGEYYAEDGEYLGLDRSLAESGRLVYVDEELELSEELSLCSCNHREGRVPIRSGDLREKQNGRLLPDRFAHEQYLTIREGGKTVLISGCSHKGILNLADWMRPDVLIGGFHFMWEELDESGSAFLEEAARALKEYPTQYYTCHCTGLPQYRFLKERMGDALHYIAAGQVFTV